MSIHVQENTGVFSLRTDHHLYQMQVAEGGVLLHLYYGEDTGDDMSYLVRLANRGFSGNPYELQDSRGFSLDTLPQEYAGNGVGDYRAPAVRTRAENGSQSVDLRFAGYRVTPGRTALPGLPFVRGDQDTETLTVTLRDDSLGLEAELNFCVFPRQDVITRSVRFTNRGQAPLTLEKAATLCVDFPFGIDDVIHFPGRHCMERMTRRQILPRGTLSLGSRRGMSSHHSNPFVILCGRDTTEHTGSCYGFMLMYSGNHLEEIDTDQNGSVRVVSGIHPEGFAWRLMPGESFVTPEGILSCSGEGLNGLSGNFHRILRENVIDRKYQTERRPILLNSWEAAYFQFDAEKILRFASAARDLGMEMLVLDDGWFGRRDTDTTSLGDWTVNEGKLGCSLRELSDRIHDMGLRFGLWFEPEMISEDSDLYRAHPDWALTDPDRKPNVSRSQLVLDLSREDVGEYLFEAISAVLDGARVDYIKWDFNRSVANCYSHTLPPDRQGETGHRCVLGIYALLDRLLRRYPDLMIEGCAGGGGRFDAGMLFYCPQIWCSDDTDPIERLEIQRGTSYGYPLSAMGSHVSASPNHQTGRTTPLDTRAIVAQAGAFGYEMKVEELSEEERACVRGQIADCIRYAELTAQGSYYRLTELQQERDFEAWMIVSPDRGEALVSLVMTHVRANGPFPWVRLRGLDSQARYRLEGEHSKDGLLLPVLAPEADSQLHGADRTMTGAALMQGGYSFPQPWGDYSAFRLHLVRVDE